MDNQAVSVIEVDTPIARHCDVDVGLTIISPVRRAQKQWQKWPLQQRAKLLRRVAAIIAHRTEELTGLLTGPSRTREEVLAAEIVPLADAAHYLSAHLPRLLRPHRESRSWRDWWTHAADIETRREPWGVVLIIGASEGRLFLTGVQMLQALAAGNGVLIRPGENGVSCAQMLRMLWVEAGGDAALIHILPEESGMGEGVLEAGVEHVVMAGDTVSGQDFCKRAAETMTPVTLSLSACDAVVIHPSGNIEQAARSISSLLNHCRDGREAFPQRIFIPRQQQADLLNALQRHAADWNACVITSEATDHVWSFVEEAVGQGARLVVGKAEGETGLGGMPLVLGDVTACMRLVQSEFPLPIAAVMTYDADDELGELLKNSSCGTSIRFFGEGKEALALARELPTGCVVLNGMEAALADPRVSASCWDASGWGVTRGPDGLRQMTRLQVVLQPRGKSSSRQEPTKPLPAEWTKGRMKWSHGRGWQKWQGLMQMLLTIWSNRSASRNHSR